MEEQNRYSDIKNVIDNLLKINSTVKRKKKAYVDKQKDLFIGIIMALQSLQSRTILTHTELRLDFSSYDEMFLQVIDSLILLHFGKEGYEVISFYLYDKFNPDGTVNELFDDNDQIVPSTTPEDIWLILQQLKKDNEK
jgi:hypothetical protein